MTRFRWYGPSIVLLCTVLLVMVLGPGLMRSLAFAQQDAEIRLIRSDLTENATLAQLSDAFKQVARAVEPSVVHIEVQGRGGQVQRFGGPGAPGAPRGLPPGMPEEFRRFFDPFGRSDGQPPEDAQPQRPGESYDQFNPYQTRGSGSGWVYRHEGDQAGAYIVTNHHVVEAAERIVVRFVDGAEAVAEVVGTDPQTDVAVLKLRGGNGPYLHPAAIAGESVEQGEMVFAFGSPFRFDFSMSQGIVSAVNRNNVRIIRDGYEDFIQTDAAINPGNSGGPLVNIRGEVVGMNTAIASRDGGFNGLGFAIPVRMATEVAGQLITEGQVRRGFLGVQIADLTPDLAESFGFKGTAGALIMDVIPGGAGEAAKLKAGDIITSVEGNPVRSVAELRARIARIKPGRPAEIKVFRDGQEQAFEVTLGSRADVGLADSTGPQRETPNGDEAVRPDRERLLQYGLSGLDSFTQELADRMDAPFEPGVVVTNVRPGSVAASAAPIPLARGTLITAVNGEPVSDEQQLAQKINATDPGQVVRLEVRSWSPNDNRWISGFTILRLPTE